MLEKLLTALIAMVLVVAPALATSHLVKGEVMKIDKSAGKITLKHAPIAKLDMGAMTMVFRVADPAMLDAVKSGDKVEPRTMQTEGEEADTKLKLAS